MRRSWTKLSNNGLKSSSTLPAQHLREGEGGREGGRERGRERGREGGREGEREGGREGERGLVTTFYIIQYLTHFFIKVDRKVDPILSDSS